MNVYNFLQGNIDRIIGPNGVLNRFFKGEMFLCYNMLNTWWFGKESKNKPSKDKWLRKFQINENDRTTNLYRIRKEIVHGRKELFHVPFDLNHLLQNERFSIAGIPCLYLANSIEIAAESIKNVDPLKFSVSKFIAKKTMKLMDLRLVPDSFKNEDDLKRYIGMLPIIIACYLPQKRENVHFIPEYVMPQLLMHTSIIGKKRFLDGVVYNQMLPPKHNYRNFKKVYVMHSLYSAIIPKDIVIR